MTYRDLLKKRTKENALSFAFEYNYISSIFFCPSCHLQCSLQKYAKSIDGKCFSCMSCQRRYSLRTNTFLYESKLSLSKFFYLVYHFLKGNYCI